MTEEFIRNITNSWIEAWNGHDLDAVLQHYTEDFEIITPMAFKIMPESNGVVKGKEKVRAYWQKGLSAIPDLKFQMMNVFTGIDSISIYYYNVATSRKAIENLFFNKSGKIYRSVVMYDFEE